MVAAHPSQTPQPALLLSRDPIHVGIRSPVPPPGLPDAARGQDTAGSRPRTRHSTRPKWGAGPSRPWPWLCWWVLREPSRAKLLPQRAQK